MHAADRLPTNLHVTGLGPANAGLLPADAGRAGRVYGANAEGRRRHGGGDGVRSRVEKAGDRYDVGSKLRITRSTLAPMRRRLRRVKTDDRMYCVGPSGT